MTITLRVYNNGDHSCIVWRPDARIDGCLGFALHRRRDGKDEALPNYVGFKAAAPGASEPSTKWPFQRFLWWDYFPGDGGPASYRVVPVRGTPDALEEADDLASDWAPPQDVTEQRTPHISAFFNRGIVATQWVARALAHLPGSSQQQKMTVAIADPKSDLRQQLSGHLRVEILRLLHEAPGPLFAALYELNDPELLQALKALGKKANLILGNGAFSKKKPDENAAVRPGLHSSINLFDRLVSAGHFAHNKFVVFCDEGGAPRKVWTGSTNWTVTGLCTQANNGILVEDDGVAAAYKDAWDRIHRAGNGYPSGLVKANSLARSFVVDDCKISVWTVPTDEQEDMQQARGLINAAREGILFLNFNPGPFQDDPDRWTLLQSVLNRHHAESNPYYNPSLYIHGVVNQPIPKLTEDPTVDAEEEGSPASHDLDPSAPTHPVVLYQRGDAPPLRAGHDVLVPAAIQEKFKNWVPELKRESIAMVHSKVIVLDPFGEHPVVMTGSHNMGPKASGKNDDNLIIIENNPSLAQAYAVNIIAIYQNYQWRLYRSQQHPANEVWSGLEDKDTWQDGHLKGWRGAELAFWLGDPPAVAPPPAPASPGRRAGANGPTHGSTRHGKKDGASRPSKKPDKRRPARRKK